MFRTLDSFLLLLDLQPRLFQPLAAHPTWKLDTLCLVDGAHHLQVPTIFTEQSPDKLGATDPEFARYAQKVFAKTSFSASMATGLVDCLQSGGCRSVVLAGLETHICVQQTALALKSCDFQVGVVADAVLADSPINHRWSLARMASLGIEILTVESILMEWTQSSEHPAFRAISGLIKAKRSRMATKTADLTETLP